MMVQIKALMVMASFPTDIFTELNPQDQEAVGFLIDSLWDDTPSEDRMQVYAGLVTIYGEDEEDNPVPVPEYIERFCHILALRYSPLPDRELMRARQTVEHIQGLTAILLKRHPGAGTVITPKEMEELEPMFQVTREQTERGIKFQFVVPEEKAPEEPPAE